MTTRPIKILSERVIPTSPAPGESQPSVAVTYQLSPLPPSVLFIAAEELPDVQWQLDNPGKADVPKDLRDKGDQVRRQRIEQLADRGRADEPRTI